MNSLSSYCGLVDAKIRASDKDLPVLSGLGSQGSNEKVFNFAKVSFFEDFLLFIIFQ